MYQKAGAYWRAHYRSQRQRTRNFSTSPPPTRVPGGTTLKTISAARKFWWAPIPVVASLAWVAYGATNISDSEAEIKEIKRRIFDVPVELPQDIPENQYNKLAYTKYYVTGELLHDREIWLVGKFKDGELGQFVITPLRRHDNGEMVLINRGWVPAIIKEQGGRPEGQVSGTVTIVGFLAPNDPGFPVKVGGVPIFEQQNLPEKNTWMRINRQEMADWVGAKPILLDALENPPNPGGFPIGGVTLFPLTNQGVFQIIQGSVSAAFFSLLWWAAWRRPPQVVGKLVFSYKPPSSTPFSK